MEHKQTVHPASLPIEAPPAAAAVAATPELAVAAAEEEFQHQHTVRLNSRGHEMLSVLASGHYVKPGHYLRQLLMEVMPLEIKRMQRRRKNAGL